MSLWDDFWDFVGDTAEDIGDTLENAWDSVKANPIGAITSVVAMSYGIPPTWAGALAGGVSAAATGGDIIKGAFTGGAMGYMGAQAGAATGALGPIAQAAAIGATSAATGAVLTGQDVLTAVKAGLILGGVSGGVAKLMTPSEAIASVTPKQLADIYASGQDPLGTLIEQQGWTSSDSAIAAASKAFSQNAATTAVMLQDYIPDYVLEAAKEATKYGGDQNAFIAKEMGWEMNAVTAKAAQNAFNDYKFGSTPAAAAGTRTIADTGLVNASDANVLASGGFTASDVEALVKAGYTASDLVDMASTGVNAQTLTNLATGAIKEGAINEILKSGGSVMDITSANQLIASGKISLDNAETLLKSGYDSSSIRSMAINGNVESAIKATNAGLSSSTVDKLINNGWDLNKITGQINDGFLDADAVNNATLKQSGWGNDVNNLVKAGDLEQQQVEIETKAAADLARAQEAAAQAKSIEEANIAQQQQIKAQEEIALAQKQAELKLEPAKIEATLANATPDVNAKYQYITNHAPTNPADLAVWQQQNNISDFDLHAAQVWDQKQAQIYNNSNGTAEWSDELHSWVAPETAGPVAPPGTVDVGGGNFMDQQGNIVDSNGNITKAAVEPSAPINQTATGYTPEQEARYNELVRSGMSPADATNMIDNGSTTSDTISVTGSAGLKGNESVVVPEYRTPNTDLATQAEIDSGDAKYNAGANAWEVPKANEPVVPVVTQPAPTTEIPEIVVTAPRPEVPQQPAVPIVVPGSVPPPVPPQPSAPTVVSSSTRTLPDGSVVRDDTKSDGTVSTVIISGPTTSTGGTGGTGGPGTDLGTIDVTAPRPDVPVEDSNPPVVIPDSGTTIKAEVLPEDQPVVPDPTVPTTPIVPIIPPVTPPTPEEDNYRGKYTWGTVKPVEKQTELNPGLINAPTFYKNVNPAQSQYYWGNHPFQPTSTFNPTLYNQIPNAPVQPWGATQAARAATSQEILAKMGSYYPSLGNTGPVRP